jgi:hypothetical protein
VRRILPSSLSLRSAAGAHCSSAPPEDLSPPLSCLPALLPPPPRRSSAPTFIFRPRTTEREEERRDMKAPLPAHFAVVALLCCCFAALAAGQSQCQNTINGLKYDLSPLSSYQQVRTTCPRSLSLSLPSRTCPPPRPRTNPFLLPLPFPFHLFLRLAEHDMGLVRGDLHSLHAHHRTCWLHPLPLTPSRNSFPFLSFPMLDPSSFFFSLSACTLQCQTYQGVALCQRVSGSTSGTTPISPGCRFRSIINY